MRLDLFRFPRQSSKCSANSGLSKTALQTINISQATGFGMIHFFEIILCDCSCVPLSWIIVFILNMMKTYPKSLQELTRIKN